MKKYQRYVCKKCGSKVVVTKNGEGCVKCCGRPMSEERLQNEAGEKQDIVTGIKL